jgi:hypothetical protein
MDEDVVRYKTTISAVGKKNKVLWKENIVNVATIAIPLHFRGIRVESLVKSGFIHMRLIGYHKQSSQELKIPINEYMTHHQNYSIYLNRILTPLYKVISTEDLVLHELLGEDNSNG